MDLVKFSKFCDLKQESFSAAGQTKIFTFSMFVFVTEYKPIFELIFHIFTWTKSAAEELPVFTMVGKIYMINNQLTCALGAAFIL